MFGSTDDPTGAAHIRQWIKYLRTLDGSIPPQMHVHRMIHPGLEPAHGGGLISPFPLGPVSAAGQTGISLAALRYLDDKSQMNDEVTDLVVSSSILGGLLTLVSNRMCEVIPELPPGGPTGLKSFLPITGSIDSLLGAPMPPWHTIDTDFRDALARLSSLPEEDSEAISAAIHLHYCASLLLARDRTGAFSLLIAGLETLAMHFGEPPSSWAEWDQASSWDSFFVDQKLSADQSSAFRDRLIHDKFMRLAETFATYVTDTLPAGFWDEKIRDYVWGVDGETGVIIEGAWMAERSRDPRFGKDRDITKAAFKKAYGVRSGFMHAGKRPISFSDDIFGTAPGRRGLWFHSHKHVLHSGP